MDCRSITRVSFSMARKLGYVYILASQRNGTLYVGVTSDPVKRVYQHKQAEMEGFTARYEIKTLVYIERHDTILEAIGREKRIKKWRRRWKLELVEKDNPEWKDLYPELVRSMTGQ